jgi:hypothetical protein
MKSVSQVWRAKLDPARVQAQSLDIHQPAVTQCFTRFWTLLHKSFKWESVLAVGSARGARFLLMQLAAMKAGSTGFG